MGLTFALFFGRLNSTTGDLERLTQLEIERQKFFLLAESSSEFIGMCDLDLNPLYVNPEGRRMVGLPDMAAACRVKVQDYFYPEDQRFIAEEFFPRVQREGHGDVEIRLRHFQTGEPIWMFYYLFCVYDATGMTIGWATVSRNITERRQAEAALRESEARLRSVTDNVSIGIVTLDRNRQYRFVNPAYLRILGLSQSADELIGRSPAEVLASIYTTQISPRLDRAFAGEKVTYELMQPLASESAPRHYTVIYEPIRDGEEINGVIVIIYDITQLKQTEDALRESEREFRVLAEAMPQIVWATGADGRNLYYNRKWSEYTGLTLEESYGEGWITPFHPDDRQKAWDAWHQATQQKEIYAVESRLRGADGTYRWWLIRGVPHFNDEGEILKWYGTCTDIQDLKEAELAIRESEARLHYALEMCNTGAWEVDLETRSAYRSIEHARIFGYADTESPWSQEKFLGHVIEEDRPEIAALVEDAFRTGSERHFECRIRRTDGEVRWIMGAGRFRVNRLDGKKQVAVGIIQDITERKNAQIALELLNDELEERVKMRTAELAALNQSLETFVYSVSHDLKTPLRGIEGYSRLLEEDYKDKLDTEGKLFLQHIREGIKRMNELIDDLLAYSRMSSRKLDNQSVDIAALLEKILQESSAEIDKREIKIDINLPIPAVHADKEGLALVLRNLLGNAFKFSHKVAEPHIEIGANQDESKITLWIKDNGIGFDMKYVDRIFEIFQRLHRLEDYPGTGIGLALVKTAMNRMGGRVWAESQPGQGATFYLELKN